MKDTIDQGISRVLGNFLDERFGLMKDLFQKTPLAVNVAYVSWGEDALWARPGGE